MTAAERADHLFVEHQRGIFQRTDRMFAWLLAIEWLGAIAASLIISPRAWTAADSQTHIHVYAALALGGIIVSLPIALVVLYPGRTLTRYVITVGQMLLSALLIHLTGGRIETHFHVFGSLAFLAFYRDWRVLILGTVIVGVDHFFRGLFWPESVYGVIIAGKWRWLEHVSWVVFEVVILLMAIRQSIQEMRAIAERQAREEGARKQAEFVNRAKDEFLATLSHELRTPLTSAVGWVGILRKTEYDPRRMEQGLAALERSVKAQVQLVDDLLDVSRIVADKFVLDSRVVLLRPILENAIELIRPMATAKNIDLRLEIANRDTVVNGDTARLQQVLVNLLSNAVKFTPAQGRVTVHVFEKDGNVTVTVTDTGRGIAAEFLPYLFKRFSQADGSTTRRFGGLGLGLAIVRHIVELHSGSVSANSEGENKGAQFTVTLPVVKNAVIVRDNQTSNSGITASRNLLQGITALVVEDETDARELIGFVLQQCGARVITAASVAEALKCLETENPDVLISDIGMPDEDGYSLIRKIRGREAREGRHLPAVALTAYAKVEDRDAALLAGFEEHLTKPIETSRLALVVAEVARKRSGAVDNN